MTGAQFIYFIDTTCHAEVEAKELEPKLENESSSILSTRKLDDSMKVIVFKKQCLLMLRGLKHTLP